MYPCGRKITHECKYRPEVRLIAVGNDYSGKGFPLKSSINDITLIWNYFRRRQCFSESQIIILGDMNVDGKLIPWKKRYHRELEPGGETIIFYYSGHGYPSGKLDVNIDLHKDSMLLIDACYAHLWEHLRSPYIVSTSTRNALSISTLKVSRFTLELTKLLNIDELNWDIFQKWAIENEFQIDLTEEDLNKLKY